MLISNFNKKILYFFAINLLSEEKNYSDLAKFFDKENINYLYCIDERIKLIKFMKMILISFCTNNL